MLRELVQRVTENHEAIVHFPIVLLTTAFIFAVMGIFYKRNLFKEVVFYNLLFGVLSLLAALYSGYNKTENWQDPLMMESLKLHQKNALILTIFTLLLFVWMAWRKNRMKSQEYFAWLALFFVTSSSVVYQGGQGYEMKILKARMVKEALPERKELDYGWNF